MRTSTLMFGIHFPLQMDLWVLWIKEDSVRKACSAKVKPGLALDRERSQALKGLTKRHFRFLSTGLPRGPMTNGRRHQTITRWTLTSVCESLSQSYMLGLYWKQIRKEPWHVEHVGLAMPRNNLTRTTDCIISIAPTDLKTELGQTTWQLRNFSNSLSSSRDHRLIFKMGHCCGDAVVSRGGDLLVVCCKFCFHSTFNTCGRENGHYYHQIFTLKY